MFNIVLVNPEIPPNTGNISRTCAVTGTRLHLIRPLGFGINDKTLKRAGLDYWKDLDVSYYDSFEELEAKYSFALARNHLVAAHRRFFLTSTHAVRSYADVEYRDGDFLVFGRETAGLGPELLTRRAKDAIRIPMRHDQRSLNLSNSAAIVLYEALRQTGFQGLE